MSGSRLRRPLLLFLAVVVVGAVVVALRGQSGPDNVGEVPAILPARGVDVGGQVVLKPLANPPANALSTAAAILRARRGEKHDYPAVALEASVTLGTNRRLQNVPAWVVTFTSPKETNVSEDKEPVLVRHYSVALDVTTGKFLVGFYTK